MIGKINISRFLIYIASLICGIIIVARPVYATNLHNMLDGTITASDNPDHDFCGYLGMWDAVTRVYAHFDSLPDPGTWTAVRFKYEFTSSGGTTIWGAPNFDWLCHTLTWNNQGSGNTPLNETMETSGYTDYIDGSIYQDLYDHGLLVKGINVLGVFNSIQMEITTADITPTPTPTPGSGWESNWMYNPGEYHWSSDFTYANSMVEAGSQWVDPITAWGHPNSRYATINYAGYSPNRAVFEWYPEPPPAWGNLIGIRLDIMGKNISNMQVRMSDYPNAVSSCSTGQISAGSVLQHNYYNITSAMCNSTYLSGLKAAMINGNLEAKLVYYYGSQTTTATIDSVAYLPIFEHGPWNFTATNSSQLIIPIAGQQVSQEDCSKMTALDKFSCNMRNWFTDQVNKIFGINQSFAKTKYTSLNTLMNTKIPFGYINAMRNLNLGSAASSSAIPDVAFNYTSKYKGQQVFSYDFLVHGTDLPDTSAIRGTLRTVITIVLWIGFIWFIVRYWRVLF